MKVPFDQAKVGHWYSICCWRDLYQIADQEQLAYLLKEEVEEPCGLMIWATQREALEDLKYGETLDGIAAIDQLLSELG
jgi:deoxyribodipyrimidine photolyase